MSTRKCVRVVVHTWASSGCAPVQAIYADCPSNDLVAVPLDVVDGSGRERRAVADATALRASSLLASRRALLQPHNRCSASAGPHGCKAQCKHSKGLKCSTRETHSYHLMAQGAFQPALLLWQASSRRHELHKEGRPYYYRTNKERFLAYEPIHLPQPRHVSLRDEPTPTK
jgi:hypothetical protein